MRKKSARPDEHLGFLVQCPVCHVARDKVCVVRERMGTDGVMIPPHPADVMHASRIEMGKKWDYWHKGLPPRGEE